MRFRALFSAVLSSLLFLSAAPGWATDADAAPSGALPTTYSGPTLHGRLELSLAEAIEMGLENNLDVRTERFSPLIAREDRIVARGAYDPEWFSEFGYSENKNLSASTLRPGTTDQSTDGFGGLRGLIPLWGAQYEFRFEGSRTTTSYSLQELSPEFRSSVSASLTVPLLRGLIWNEAWTHVKRTRILHDSSREGFRKQVMDTVQAIEDGYWNLVAAQEQRRVAEKSQETARALLEQTETQYGVGVVSKVEVTEAEAGVAQRDFNLIVADNDARNAQDVLIDLILGPNLTPASTLEIEPTDRPDDYVPYEIDLEESVRTAFERRPELAMADREIERNRLELKFARNQRLPQLDGIVSYGVDGLGGRRNKAYNPCRLTTSTPAEYAACIAALPPTPTTQFDDTFEDYFERDGGNQFMARALLSIPIPNTAARHRVSKTELELRRAITQKRRAEQGVILEVRKAVRDLKSAQEGIEAARRARIAAEEQLRSERIRLEYGESTPFDVLLRESDFVEAESGEIGAFRVYRTSATALDRAQGTILRSNRIEIDEVSALR